MENKELIRELEYALIYGNRATANSEETQDVSYAALLIFFINLSQEIFYTEK